MRTHPISNHTPTWASMETSHRFSSGTALLAHHRQRICISIYHIKNIFLLFVGHVQQENETLTTHSYTYISVH